MSTAPDDVKKATNAACDELSRHTDALGLADFTELQRVFATAIMAERERCADIADKVASENNTGSGFDSHPAYSAAWRIANAIRKGEA